MGKKDDRYYMSSVKLGPKGQIVIPKEARAMFGLEPGYTLVLLAQPDETAEMGQWLARGVYGEPGWRRLRCGNWQPPAASGC